MLNKPVDPKALGTRLPVIREEGSGAGTAARNPGYSRANLGWSTAPCLDLAAAAQAGSQ